MKKILCILVLVGYLANNSFGQLTNGSIAPDFTLQDINGTPHTLYTYLNQGKYVAVDVSATWCVPCWNYHNTHKMDTLFQNYDQPGSKTWKVLFIEADGNTSSADLQGSGTNTQGDWITGSNYTIIDPPAGATLSDFRDGFSIDFYPMFYLICPNKKVYHVGANPSLGAWAAASNNCLPAGVDDLSLGIAFSIYPNPAKHTTRIYLQLASTSETVLHVKSVDGKVIQARSLGMLFPGEQSIDIDLSSFNAGIYFVSIETKDNSITQKLVVY